VDYGRLSSYCPHSTVRAASQGRPVTVSLAVPGAQQQSESATLCTPAGTDIGDYTALIAGAADFPGALYAIPFRASRLHFYYGATWQGSGKQYLLSGATTRIPASPQFSFPAADLSRLTFRLASGASEGNRGDLSVAANTACGPGPPGTGFSSLPVPSQESQYVSAGSWWANFAPNDLNDDTTSLVQSVAPGRAYTRTFGGAVRGPGPITLPHFEAALRRGEFWFSLISLYHDPGASGDECCAAGVVRLRAHGHVLKTYRFEDNNAAVFKGNLRRPGWYTINLTSRRDPARPGVTPATLSTRIALTWRFIATARDLMTTFIGVPASVITLRPQGLDLRNNAARGSVTPIRLTIWRGRPYPAYRIKSVRLLVSYGGGSWQAVRVTGRGSNWLAKVRAATSGFISLRCIVTDIKGDRSVETVYRAYRVS
jgi:hypothetical protein